MISSSELTEKQLKSLTETNVQISGVGGQVRTVGQCTVDIVLDEKLHIENVVCLVIDANIPTLLGLNVLKHSSVRSFPLMEINV